MSRRDEQGQAVVEFALVLPLMLLLLVGIIDAAGAVWASNTLAGAAREGTRYAIVHGASSEYPSGPGSATFTSPDQDSAVTDVVRQRAAGLVGVEVAATWPDGDNGRGSRVTVVAHVRYRLMVLGALFGDGLAVTLSHGSTLVIHR